MQRTEQSTASQPVAVGIPGTASNAPNTHALPVYPQQSTAPETAKSESGTYGASKTVRHVVENPGKVRRMTAAIVVNDRLLQLATRDRAAQWQPRSADELHNLTALAQAAVGFDSTRGDLLTVQDLAFEENRTQPPVNRVGQWLSMAENSPVVVKYAALLAGLLVVVAFGVRPALRRARSSPVRKEAGAGVGKALPGQAGAPEQPALPPLEPAAPDPERVRAQEIYEQVTGHLKQEPAQSSRLLQSWIHSE
jgi:flagellar M-ring protein FliF